MTKIKFLQTVAIAAFLFFGISYAAEIASIDKTAPNFTLTDSHGKKHSLSDYKGKWVVLEWTNFNCPFVKKHYNSNNMQKLQKEYTTKGVIWLSINSSAPGKEGNFSNDTINKKIAEFKANMTAYLLDQEGKVGKMYGAKTTPHIFIINPKGELIYAGAADNIRSTDIADIKKADNYIKMTLDAAMNGKPVEVKTTQPYGCGVKY